jgi:hypothetical protein
MSDSNITYVIINGRFVPAINVHLGAMYFEVVFDDAEIWRVTSGIGNDPSKITVGEYDIYAPSDYLDHPKFERIVSNWDQFLAMYDAKLNRR